MTMPDITGRDPIYGDLVTSWKWMLALGILMIVLGIIGVGMANTLTLVSVIWFGVLALIGGIAQLIDAFRCAGWKAVLGHVLLGLLYVAAGVIMIAMPVQSAWWLTLLIAIWLIVSGIMRAIMAFQSGSGTAAFLFLLVSGIISVILGVMIFGLVELPSNEAVATVETATAWYGEWGWVIGLFVALELLLQGVTMVMVALTARKAGEMLAPPSDGTTAAS